MRLVPGKYNTRFSLALVTSSLQRLGAMPNPEEPYAYWHSAVLGEAKARMLHLQRLI